jgi:Mn-dependent DtxR family transcriptional regulator
MISPKVFTKEKKKAQQIRTIEALKIEPATSMMISKRLNIQRSNVTRHLYYLEKQGKVVVVKEEPCRITGYKAKYYSTNPIHFPKEKQSELFISGGCLV